MARRIIRAAGLRAGGSDPGEHLRQLLELQAEIDAAATMAVRFMRQAGVTWEQIGEATHTTRQAALMRWGPKIQAAASTNGSLGDST